MARHIWPTVTAGTIAALSGLLLSFVPAVASAEPLEAVFAEEIDDHADYDGADGCSAGDKPGAVALKNLTLAAYPGTTGYISRACSGGTSEHEQGRAFDWMVRADTQHDIADDMLDWLLADDSYGNKHAMARRLGIMYIIFDHRMWRAYDADEGWQPYGGSNPHTDHVHISMSWDGARTETTWFTGIEAGMRLDQARYATTWRDPGRIDVFRRGPSHELQTRTWEAGWSGWEDLGGDLGSGPAAVWAGKTLWVFARSTDGLLVQRRWKAKAGWEPWEDTGVEITAAPAVANLGKRVDLVVRTPTTSAAVTSWKPRRGWSAFEDLGGVLTAPPAVVWREAEHLDVFARGTSGALYQRSKIDGVWGGWVNLGGLLTAGPAATSFTLGESDVYVRTATGTISHRSDSGAGWSGWTDIGGRHVSGPAMAAIRDVTLDAFTRVRAGGLNQNYYRSGTGWSGWRLQ